MVIFRIRLLLKSSRLMFKIHFVSSGLGAKYCVGYFLNDLH